MTTQTAAYFDIFNKATQTAPIEPMTILRLFGVEAAQIFAAWWLMRRMAI